MLAICLFLTTVFAVISATDTMAATKVSISNKTATIYVNQSKKLSMKGTKSKVSWSSSNKAVAKVNSKGNVTGVKAGTATIKAKVSKKTYTCKVTVKNPSLNHKKLSLEVKKTANLKLVGATIKDVKSSNTKIAKVTKAGKVTAVKAGSTTITIKDTKGRKYTCKVTVTAAQKKIFICKLHNEEREI
ncbi:hypothetical protein P261_00297 [Lachnospiraceae bacterium TWA4]|nr:hypothetical protein P261_00297 [Lachnospiraceae bacterium TWA4]